MMSMGMSRVLVGATLGLALSGCAGADDSDATAVIQQAATDGDNAAPGCGHAAIAITYPLNRVYDPANTLLGCECVTTSGWFGTLQSKCAVKPSTCGYLYCTPVPP